MDTIELATTRFVFVKLDLPFCLYLRDGPYHVTVPELNTTETILVILSKFRRELEKIDYHTFWQAELTGTGELWNDKNGTFRRTAATVVLPASVVQTHSDPNNNSYAEDFEIIIDATVKTLNRLVAIYRYVTADTYIPTLVPDDVDNCVHIGTCTVTADGSIRGCGHLGGNDRRLTNTHPDYDESTHSDIRRLLANTELIPLYEDFLVSARRLLQEGNTRACIIEVQTAFEVFVGDTVRQYYLTRHGNVGKIMNCGFKNLVKDHLERATEKTFKPEEPNYDRWFTDTYTMRNKVVHQGYGASQDEGTKAVLGVEYALEYLIGRPREKFWPKIRPVTVINEFVPKNDS